MHVLKVTHIPSLLSALLVLSLLQANRAGAQVVPDATLPLNSITAPGCVQCTITGGTQQGSNLFHSFQQFSIPTNGNAVFNNPIEVRNIVTRVTGINPSSIDGLISSNGAANFIFINPNGVSFGANARLNVGGSFLSSTAKTVLFADGTQYGTNPGESSPLLSSSIPIGLGLLNPAPIQVQGTGHAIVRTGSLPFLAVPSGVGTSSNGLSVKPGQTLALVGGDFAANGGVLNAPSGHIEVASLGSGTVRFNPTRPGWAFSYDGIKGFNNLLLTNRSILDTTGLGGSSIRLQAKQIRIDQGSLVFDFSQGKLESQSVFLAASEQISVLGTAPFVSQPSGVYTYTIGAAKGGDIEVKTPLLQMQQGGLLLTKAFGAGNAGNLNISVPDIIQLDGTSRTDPRIQSSIASIASSTGGAGDVRVNTGRLEISNGAFLESGTFGPSEGGAVSVSATQSIELNGVARPILQPSLLGSTTLGSGNAGSVTVNTPVLRVLGGGRVDSSTTNTGNAGNLLITASDSILVSGKVPNSQNPSIISSAAESADPILRQTFGLPAIPTGKAGSLNLQTPNLVVNDGGLIAVRNTGPNDAGDLFINTRQLRLQGGGITAATNGGNGGIIGINTSALILQRQGFVTATAGGSGNGGNVTIDSDVIALLDSSRISANATRGRGGQIQISALGLFRNPNALISATSGVPQLNGTVEINTPNVDLSRGSLPAPPPISAPQIASVCQTTASSEESQFVVSGTGGIPQSPSDQLDSNGWIDPNSTSSELTRPLPARAHRRIVEAQGWIIANGKLSLTATPDQSTVYAANRTPGCH